MKTSEQLKGTIRSMAAKKNLRAQEILQMFLFEHVLERLANSAYKNNFILKGGLASVPLWIWTRRYVVFRWKRTKS